MSLPEAFQRIMDASPLGRKAAGDVPIHDGEARKQLFSTFSKSLVAHPDVFFYESMSGYKVMDSPESLFREVRSGRTRSLHVWSVSDRAVLPDDLHEEEDLILVKRHSPQYLYWLARAGHIVGNSVFPDYFVRRQDQKYLNTWHGIGYKTLGRSEASPLGAALAVGNMLQATHVVSPCEFMTGIHMHNLSMAGAFVGSLAESGYPRVDVVVNQTPQEKAQLADMLGTDPGKATVLYAPTWRGTGGSNEFDTDRLVADLEALQSDSTNLVFLSHHMAQQHIRGLDLEGVFIPPANANTNAILAMADLLITDYSSIFFDFLVTGRPVVHYLYDYEEYSETRGVTLSPEELPGAVVLDPGDLAAEVDRLLVGMSADEVVRYRAAAARFSPYDDGEASARVARWFIDGDRSEVREVTSHKVLPKAAWWGGLLNNEDETPEFLSSLQDQLNEGTHDVTLIVARSAKKNPLLMDFLEQNSRRISIVARSGYEAGMTADEQRARETLGKESLPETRELYYDIYRREYRRLLGDTRFDKVHKAHTLSRFWMELSKYALK